MAERPLPSSVGGGESSAQGITAMAEQLPSISSAGGGESSAQVHNPQQFATSTGATVTPMMMDQQQQQQQQQTPGQQQLQQRATPVGRRQQQQQQISAGPYEQQQQFVHPMASEASVNQGRPGPQGTTGAGTPHYANMPMTQQQNMQESPTERLRNSASSEESVGIPKINVVPSVLNLWHTIWSPLNDLSDLRAVVDEHDVSRRRSLLGAEWYDASLPRRIETRPWKIPPSTQELPPEPDVEPDTKHGTVTQKSNPVQTPYMGALPQQNLGASRQGVPLTSQQQQQQQQVLHNRQQLPQQRLATPQQQNLQSQNQESESYDPPFSPYLQVTRGPPARINLNNGLPHRPGEKLCKPYARGEICTYGTSCLFHHPWPRVTLYPSTPKEKKN